MSDANSNLISSAISIKIAAYNPKREVRAPSTASKAVNLLSSSLIVSIPLSAKIV
ncbi:hypothetical protein Hanom_Chr17g01538731 [Helianthus anomalus]